MSMFSRTTVGGGTFEDVVKGKQNYVAQKECLIDLRNEKNTDLKSKKDKDLRNEEDIDRVKQNLVEHCDEILTRLEEESLCTVEKFYIGKTLITRRRKPRGKGFVKFDPMDPNTWKKNGISSRWGTHKNEDYGRDGMIVLTAITREALLNRHQGGLHQEQYALALEQMLQHHYKLKKKDSRFANKTFTSGGSDKGKSIAYAVYVAFRLSDYEEETSMEDSSSDSSCTLGSEDDSVFSLDLLPSRKYMVYQQPKITPMSESPYCPQREYKRPRKEPHPPGAKRRHPMSSQDATIRSSIDSDYSTPQEMKYRRFKRSPLISPTSSPPILRHHLHKQHKSAMVKDLLYEKESSNGIQQKPHQEMSYKHQNARLSTKIPLTRPEMKVPQHIPAATATPLHVEQMHHRILESCNNRLAQYYSKTNTDQGVHTNSSQASQATAAYISTSPTGAVNFKPKKKVPLGSKTTPTKISPSFARSKKKLKKVRFFQDE